MVLAKLPRHERVEAVDKRMVTSERAAVFLGQAVVLSVHPMPCGEIWVVHQFAPEHVAIFERGDDCPVELRQLDAGELWHGFELWGESAHAEFLFEQRDRNS